MTGPECDLAVLKTFAELGFITSSAGLSSLLQKARRAAEVSDINVLIEGETGTGKHVLARSIHELDEKRRGFSFVTVHCGTINEALAESELFGHHRGAFSGAISERKGLFQAAHHGTLLLDDVNDLPLGLQPKLLDVIQRRVVRAVGSDRELPIDLRIIAASNQPLEPLIRQGRFRSDLYHRLDVVKLCLPPLRERKADLGGLVLALATRHRGLYDHIETVDPELITLLEAVPFEGNVRELENAVQRMLFLKTTGRSLGLADWMAQAGHESGTALQDFISDAASALWKAISTRGISYAQAFQEMERRLLETALDRGGPNRRAIAQRLQTSERTLYYKMRTHHLNPSSR